MLRQGQAVNVSASEENQIGSLSGVSTALRPYGDGPLHSRYSLAAIKAVERLIIVSLPICRFAHGVACMDLVKSSR